jgi:hypothetical protein
MRSDSSHLKVHQSLARFLGRDDKEKGAGWNGKGKGGGDCAAPFVIPTGAGAAAQAEVPAERRDLLIALPSRRGDSSIPLRSSRNDKEKGAPVRKTKEINATLRTAKENGALIRTTKDLLQPDPLQHADILALDHLDAGGAHLLDRVLDVAGRQVDAAGGVLDQKCLEA